MADEDAPSLEIRILQSDRPDGSCPVLIEAADDRGDVGRFLSPFNEEQLAAANVALDAGQMDTESAREFGEALFGALIRDGIKTVYDGTAATAEPVGVRLLVDDPGAAKIPWELLADPAERMPFATRHRLVRGFKTPGGARPLMVTPPLRILLAELSPSGLLRLPSQLEIKDIRDALEPVAAWRRISVDVLENATEDTLQDALREAKEAKQPRPIHVLHWIGHGAIDPTTKEISLVFERKDGGQAFVRRPRAGADPQRIRHPPRLPQRLPLRGPTRRGPTGHPTRPRSS